MSDYDYLIKKMYSCALEIQKESKKPHEIIKADILMKYYYHPWVSGLTQSQPTSNLPSNDTPSPIFTTDVDKKVEEIYRAFENILRYSDTIDNYIEKTDSENLKKYSGLLKDEIDKFYKTSGNFEFLEGLYKQLPGDTSNHTSRLTR